MYYTPLRSDPDVDVAARPAPLTLGRVLATLAAVLGALFVASVITGVTAGPVIVEAATHRSPAAVAAAVAAVLVLRRRRVVQHW